MAHAICTCVFEYEVATQYPITGGDMPFGHSANLNSARVGVIVFAE